MIGNIPFERVLNESRPQFSTSENGVTEESDTKRSRAVMKNTYMQ